MDKNSVHCTTPTPTSSPPRCGSSPAWSASMSECGSAPEGKDSFPPFALLGFVAATHRSSYGALPRTSPPQLRPSRNESPSRRERLVSTIYKIGSVAETHRTSYETPSKRVPPQLRPPRNESPSAREGLVSTIYKIGFVAATHRSSYVAPPKTSPSPRNESPIPAIASTSCLPNQLSQYTIDTQKQVLVDGAFGRQGMAWSAAVSMTTRRRILSERYF